MFVSLSRLIIALIIVRLVNAEVFGAYVVVMSIVFIGEWLMDFGFTDIAVRNISQDKESREKTIAAFVLLKCLQAVITCAVVVLVVYLLGYTELLPAIGIGSLGLLFYGVAQTYRVDFRVNITMYKDMLSESSGVLAMILLVFFVSAAGGGVTELVACHSISRLIYLAGNWYQREVRGSPIASCTSGRDAFTLLKQASPLGLAGVLVACYDSIIPLVLAKLMDMEAVAQYTIAIRLVLPIVLITQAISNVFFTPLAESWSSNKPKFISTQQNLLEIVCVVSCAFFCVVYSSSEFIVSFFGESVSESAAILRVLSWAIVARAVTIAMSSPIIICGGQRKTMWLTLIVVVFSALLVVYLVPRYGIYGAVGAYLFVEILVTAVPVVFVSQYMANYKLNWVPIAKLFLASAISIGLISMSASDGTAFGGIFSGLLFAAIAVFTGAISKDKFSELIKIIRYRANASS